MSDVATAGLQRPRAEITAVVLLACKCGAPHPGWAPYEIDPADLKTVLPRRLVADCPDCGAATRTGESRRVTGKIIGFWGSFFDFFERMYNTGKRWRDGA